MGSSKVFAGRTDQVYIELDQLTDENLEVYLAAFLVVYDFGVNAVLEELGPLDLEGNTEVLPHDIDLWEQKWTRFCEENNITLWVSANVSEWRDELKLPEEQEND